MKETEFPRSDIFVAEVPLSATLLLFSLAFADIPPPEVEACSGKSVGQSCAGGSCQNGTCSRATPDGMHEYDCVKCVAGDVKPEKPPEPRPADAKKQDGCNSVGQFPGWGLLLGLVALRSRRR